MRGQASWYGTSAHGKLTANGEIYNREALTAAHKQLPFGTVVRVYNLRNNRFVLVRVNDRGPFVQGRVLDISLRAAESLRMLRSGVARVVYEIVSDKQGRPLNGDNGFYVHVSTEESFVQSRISAAALAERLDLEIRALSYRRGNYQSYALCAGPFETFDAAQQVFLKIEDQDRPALGIIEGPLTGFSLPKRTPPGRERPAPAGKKVAADSRDTPADADMGKGTLFFSLVKSLVPGLTGNPALFLLPSATLTGGLSSQ